MSKTYVLSMVYCNTDVFRAGMASFRRTVAPGSFTEHILLDQHYPIRHRETQDAISDYVDTAKYSVRVLDAGKNLGLHRGLDYMLSQLQLEPDDVIVAFDCDEDPYSPGWLEAMQRVMAADPKCGWISMMGPPIRAHLDQHAIPVTKVGGEDLRIPGGALMNVLCAWRAGAIAAAGGKFTEPFEYYGGLELHMQPRFQEAGYWVGWLNDWYTAPHHGLHDPEYTQYKRRHVGFEEPQFGGSFDEFLLLEK